ncbi:hypothetical protein FOZ63_003437, partial [Perkinsus olseni]
AVEEVLDDLRDDGVVCDVCLIGDQDDDQGNADIIVICDACEAAVHQNCYGVSPVPTGEWYCDFCTYAREAGLSPEEQKREKQCLLCPRRTGALLRIKDGKFGGYWIHAACAWWIPECSIQEGRYGYIALDAASMRNLQQRFKAACDVCHLPNIGAVLQCSTEDCYRGFHIPCARAMNYGLDLVAEADRIEDEEEGDVVLPLRAYCDKHRHAAYPDEPRFKQWKSDHRERVCYVQNLINRNRTILIDMNQNIKDGSRWALLINEKLAQELDANIRECQQPSVAPLMSSNLSKPTRSSIAKAKNSNSEQARLDNAASEEVEARRGPRTPVQLLADDDISDEEAGTAGQARPPPIKERPSTSPTRAGERGGSMDPTVLAFAQWLSYFRASSEEEKRDTAAAVRQCGREAKIQRTAVDLLRRDLNTVSTTWQQQFEAAYKALEMASKDIAALKKSRNKFEDSVREEVASLVEILSGMNREIKMLREERHEEATGVKEEVQQLRAELDDLRREFREHCAEGCQKSDENLQRRSAEGPTSPFQRASPVQRSEGGAEESTALRTHPNTPRTSRASPGPWESAPMADTVSPRTMNAHVESSSIPAYTIPPRSSIDIRSFDGIERAKLVSMNHRPADVVSWPSRSSLVQSWTPRSQTGAAYFGG